MINSLVVWGGQEDLSSHRWIHRAYHETARKIGIRTKWLPNAPESNYLIEAGDTVLSADIFGDHLRPHKHVNYVLHNFSADHPVMQQTDPEHILRLQVWTHDAFGEEWDDCRQYSVEGRILFQPWGTDLLAEEFMDPVFNPLSRTAVFVGAVWTQEHQGADLGNTQSIETLRNVLREYGLTFQHRTQVSVAENIDAVREARLAPAIAGGWQVEHGYLPCRLFKNVSYGTLGFTNVETARFLLGELAGGSIETLIPAVVKLRKGEYEELVREQQRKVSNYTYRQSLEAISRAFES